MRRVSQALARNGRLVLVAGLVVGAGAPGLAAALVPFIVPGVALLLFLATLRVGPAAFALPARAWRVEALRALILQGACPLLALWALQSAGVAATALGLGVVMTLAASPVTGSPGLAILSGVDPAPALRAMAVGTAVFPLTVVPVLAAVPALGPAAEVAWAALRLLALVGLAGGGALLLRARLPALGRPDAAVALDGAITLVMAVVVIALMAEVGPALRGSPGPLLMTFAVVLLVSFGVQVVAFFAYRRAGSGAAGPGLAIAAGNRNLALLFAALPEETRAALLLYLGLYQIPMYLTPLVLRPLYALADRAD